MTPFQESNVYDALCMLQTNYVALLLMNPHGADAGNRALINGVYVAIIKLQVALGPCAIERGKDRHDKIETEKKEYLAFLDSIACINDTTSNERTS